MKPKKYNKAVKNYVDRKHKYWEKERIRQLRYFQENTNKNTQLFSTQTQTNKPKKIFIVRFTILTIDLQKTLDKCNEELRFIINNQGRKIYKPSGIRFINILSYPNKDNFKEIVYNIVCSTFDSAMFITSELARKSRSCTFKFKLKHENSISIERTFTKHHRDKFFTASQLYNHFGDKLAFIELDNFTIHFDTTNLELWDFNPINQERFIYIDKPKYRSYQTFGATFKHKEQTPELYGMSINLKTITQSKPERKQTPQQTVLHKNAIIAWNNRPKWWTQKHFDIE